MVNFNQALYHAYQGTLSPKEKYRYELEYVQLLPTKIRSTMGVSIYIGQPSDYPWAKFCQMVQQPVTTNEPLYVKPFSKPLKGKLEEAIEWHENNAFTVLGTTWEIKTTARVSYPPLERVLGGKNKDDPTVFDRIKFFPLLESAWMDMLKQRSKIPVTVCPKTQLPLRTVTIILNQGEITIFGENMPKMILSNRAAKDSRIMRFNLCLWPTFNFPPMEIGMSEDFLGFRRGREKWLIAPIKQS